jgi:hypothetical protein
MEQLALDVLADQPFELEEVAVGVGSDLRQVHPQRFNGHAFLLVSDATPRVN